MSIIILIGAIYMLINGNLFQCLLFIGLVATVSNKYTDNHRRKDWWK